MAPGGWSSLDVNASSIALTGMPNNTSHASAVGTGHGKLYRTTRTTRTIDTNGTWASVSPLAGPSDSTASKVTLAGMTDSTSRYLVTGPRWPPHPSRRN
ncbi:hypothetical protein AB0D08_18705 [Kitasatospora sp. NPDC048540]|uniref:hypothetical protein n=1 Tax=unclassified Kitasatospora TaxID=2633591 RepID=UPI00053B73D7|nr:hypothetical protein [Kitasatospora sp. MBT63]